MSQLRKVTEYSGVHKQCGLAPSGKTTQLLTAHLRTIVGLLKQTGGGAGG